MSRAAETYSAAQRRLWRTFAYALLLIVFALLFEILLVAGLSGQWPNLATSRAFANSGFFADYLLEAPGTALRLLLIDLPLLEIAAVHADSGTDIWRLHYFNYAVVAHLALALLLMRYWYGIRRGTWQRQVVIAAGALLLVTSSLYLFHAACCTGGPLWIMHTALIAGVFNPVTATPGRLEIYALLQPWFAWLQAGFALGGLLLLGLGLRRTPN